MTQEVPMYPDEQSIAERALLLSDPWRVAILSALSSEPQTVSELTARVGAPQPRISSHLAILREAGWIEADSDGRQRRYRLTSPSIGDALRTLSEVGSAPAAESKKGRQYRKPRPDQPLRHARSCYDHLAGVAGVTVCKAFLDRGWIEPVVGGRGTFQPGYALTDVGRAALSTRGVAIPTDTLQRRRFAYACPDWTEPGAHIGGALGAAILQRLAEVGVITRIPGDRTLRLSGDLEAWIDSVATPGSANKASAQAMS
jgi:DNA-binding transcriptional ArsR family regulator